jgi:hypothetical protein
MQGADGKRVITFEILWLAAGDPEWTEMCRVNELVAVNEPEDRIVSTTEAEALATM